MLVFEVSILTSAYSYHAYKQKDGERFYLRDIFKLNLSAFYNTIKCSSDLRKFVDFIGLVTFINLKISSNQLL